MSDPDPARCRLYLITPPKLDPAAFSRALVGALDAGDVACVQLRLKDVDDDTIRRLQAYQEAGADVLYAPGIKTREQIAAVVSSVDRPVNFLMGTQPERFTLAELSALGVRRVSVGSALSLAALGAFLRAAREMATTGTFTYTQDCAGFAEITKLLSQPRENDDV